MVSKDMDCFAMEIETLESTKKFGNLICKDNGFQQLDFISSNQKEYFDFITGNLISFKNRLAKTMCRVCFCIPSVCKSSKHYSGKNHLN